MLFKKVIKYFHIKYGNIWVSTLIFHLLFKFQISVFILSSFIVWINLLLCKYNKQLLNLYINFLIINIVYSCIFDCYINILTINILIKPTKQAGTFLSLVTNTIIIKLKLFFVTLNYYKLL